MTYDVYLRVRVRKKQNHKQKNKIIEGDELKGRNNNMDEFMG